MLLESKHTRLWYNSPRVCIGCIRQVQCIHALGGHPIHLSEPMFLVRGRRLLTWAHALWKLGSGYPIKAYIFFKKNFVKKFFGFIKKKIFRWILYVSTKKVWISGPHVLHDQGQMLILSDVQARILDGWINFICKL